MLLLLACADAVPSYTIHEWGTFTTVADAKGDPMPWRPLIGRPDLPPFVYEWKPGGKGHAVSLVRMETPVIYFYADQPLTVSVDVAFPDGEFTEWYPRADVLPKHIVWNNVQIGVEGAPPPSPVESHYLAARNVASDMIAVGEEREQFLFYRGVARFQPGRRFRLDGDTVHAEGEGAWILFHNEGGRQGYSVQSGASAPVPPLDGGDVTVELQRTLVAAGLYEDEAKAMIETWRGDWFDEGLRAFWLYDSAAVDKVLPLTLNPAPAKRLRVLVGRTEMILPAWVAEAKELTRTHPDTLEAALAARFGRFAASVAHIGADMTPEGGRLFQVWQFGESAVLD